MALYSPRKNGRSHWPHDNLSLIKRTRVYCYQLLSASTLKCKSYYFGEVIQPAKARLSLLSLIVATSASRYVRNDFTGAISNVSISSLFHSASLHHKGSCTQQYSGFLARGTVAAPVRLGTHASVYLYFDQDGLLIKLITAFDQLLICNHQRIRLQFQTPPRCVPRYPQHVRTKYGYNFVWRIQWLLFMIGCSSNSIYHCCSTQSVVIRERIYSISSRRTPARAPLRTASWHLLIMGLSP